MLEPARKLFDTIFLLFLERKSRNISADFANAK